jgi:hypothetical protein
MDITIYEFCIMVGGHTTVKLEVIKWGVTYIDFLTSI